MTPMIRQIIARYRMAGFRGVRASIAYRLNSIVGAKRSPLTPALDTIIADGNFVIVQIGAYIGSTLNDPLYRPIRSALKHGKGRLVCVEPVKQYYDELVRNYRGVPHMFFENVAIAEVEGRAPFYRLGVDPADYGYPAWLAQLGSLKPDRLGALWEQPEGNAEHEQYRQFCLQHRIEEIVECITLSALMARHKLDRIDLLQMDTEGYELEILSTIDFARYPIRFLNYERVLLYERQEEAEELLRKHGYRLIDHGQDTFCYQEADQQCIERKG